MNKKLKEWIDNASYTQLLKRWRFSPLGDEMCSGEIGKYFKEKMISKKKEIGELEAAKISKMIGWKL